MDKIAAQVEAKLRQEIGLAGAIGYRLEAGNAADGGLVGSTLRRLYGSRPDLLFMIVFDLRLPRPISIHVIVSRQGVGSFVSGLLFEAVLAGNVSGGAELEPSKFFGMAKFRGSPELVSCLNTHQELLKRLDKIARTESEIGGIPIKAERFVSVTAIDQGALLLLNVLPRTTSMGFDASLDAKEVLDILPLVESVIQQAD